MVCSDECEVQAKMELSTARLLGHVRVMALDPEPKSDGSLLQAKIADLKRDQARILRQPVCPGKRVLWIRCVAGRGWFEDGFSSSVARKDALQRVIGEKMLVDVVQVMESKSKWDLWYFQVIISSTTNASVPYLCQKKYLEVSRPGVGGPATFIVETGSHPAFASHLLEVQVRGAPLFSSEIKALVEVSIESMQPPASSARRGETKGPDSVFFYGAWRSNGVGSPK